MARNTYRTLVLSLAYMAFLVRGNMIAEKRDALERRDCKLDPS